MPRWFEARQSGRPGAVAAPTESTPVVMSAMGVGLRLPERESDCSGQRPAWYPFSVNVCDGEFDPEDRDLTEREMSAGVGQPTLLGPETLLGSDLLLGWDT